MTTSGSVSDRRERLVVRNRCFVSLVEPAWGRRCSFSLIRLLCRLFRAFRSLLGPRWLQRRILPWNCHSGVGIRGCRVSFVRPAKRLRNARDSIEHSWLAMVVWTRKCPLELPGHCHGERCWWLLLKWDENKEKKCIFLGVIVFVWRQIIPKQEYWWLILNFEQQSYKSNGKRFSKQFWFINIRMYCKSNCQFPANDINICKYSE